MKGTKSQNFKGYKVVHIYPEISEEENKRRQRRTLEIIYSALKEN